MKKYGKRILTAAAGTFVFLMLAACGSAGMDQGEAYFQSNTASNSYSGSSSQAYDDYGLEMEYETYYEEADMPTVNQKTQQNADLSDRKLIRTVSMDVETKEYDQLLSTLESRVQSVGGYIENLDSYNGSSYSGYRSSRHANLTIRIPKAEMDGFLELVSDVGNVTRRSDSVEDVTLTYVDLESHRNALRTEQDRLLELLEQAENLEDILTIEDRLANIRYQLESMESRLRTMDNQVDYSTLYLNVSEVQELTPVTEQTVWERVKEGFGDSVENIKDGAVEIAVWFMVNSPYLILLFAVVVLFIVIIKISWKKSMRKAAEKNSDTQGSETPRGDK